MLEEINKTIKLTTDTYLNKFLPKISDEKKPSAIEAYEKDIVRMTYYVLDSGFLNTDFQLSEDFLKLFHKSLYPNGYTQKQKDEEGKEFIWMIPGEYKQIKIMSKDWDLCKDLPNWTPDYELYTLPENTKKEMGILIGNYNNDLEKINKLKEKINYILFFTFKLLYIHPFSDGNGRLVFILCDLLCLKFGITPFHFMGLREFDRQGLHKAIFMSHIQKDLKYIYSFIEKYS